MSVKFQAPPEWGIEPVPKGKRSLSFKDFAVLWGDLGIGLLVILAGTFLVPGLGLGAAAAAILVGTALGSFLLGLVGKIGSDSGRPTMALLRPLLGRRGSYAPTVLNVVQLLGWAVFEFIIMGVAMNAICSRLFGFSSYPLWTAVSALVIVLLGLAGPVAFVKQWLEKFAVWVALATGVWLAWRLLGAYDLRAFLARPGDGSLPYWQGVDLVIALPVSWLPLVADYNRFAKRGPSAFWGTVLGFFVTGTWFLAMGAFLMLGSSVKQEPKDFATAIALIGGWGALLILLADETHNAWADLYSAAVSAQNIFPKAKQRWLIIGFGAFCLAAALILDITRYQGFLYLLGSFFIPLFGVLTADYFVLREREAEGRAGHSDRSGRAMLAWALGIAAYHATNPSTLASIFPMWAKLVPQGLTLIGGSIPSFALSFYSLFGHSDDFTNKEESGMSVDYANFGDFAGELLARLRDQRPLVHHITNFVVMNDTANATLALGALPVMAHAKEEVAEMVQAAGALVLNPGTLEPDWVEAMLIAGRRANELGIPVVYDPVGVGATRYRSETGELFLRELRLSVVRGNSGEIGSLSGAGGLVKGVDSVRGVADPVAVVRGLAKRIGATVAITGKRDVLSDGASVTGVDNGHEMMTLVTGTGCMATAIIAAFCAVERDALAAATAALACYGIAGQEAARGARGPGSFRAALIDAIYALTPAKVAAEAMAVGL